MVDEPASSIHAEAGRARDRAVPVTEFVADGSLQLEAVKKLWRKDSATLGFFPDGAFAEYAQKRQIIAAVRNGAVLGYVLFRRTGRRVAIVHLCIDQIARGQGVARELAEAVSRAAPDADGVSLRCRRDFAADAVWPKLGFRPIKELPGRGTGGGVLTVWFKSHGKDDLFTLAAKRRESRTIAVVDANVFFDLAEAEERPPNESKALVADWLQDILELKITAELFSEVMRADSPETRKRNLAFAQQFGVVDATPDALQSAARVVEQVLPAPRNQRDRSDRAHLAACVAAQVKHFVTRDDLLREYGDALYERTGISVLRPSELIAELDEIERADAYRPARFAGTTMQLVPASDLSEDDLVEKFKGQHRRSEFLADVRARIAAPRAQVTQVVVASGAPVALVSMDRAPGACLRVGLLRVAGDDARTLASYLAHHIRVAAVERKAALVVVADAGVDAHVRAALEDDEFIFNDGRWARVVCRALGGRNDLRSWFGALKNELGAVDSELLDDVEAGGLFDEATPTAVIERRLWPVKVLDETLPCYVVPVRPHWAHQLFDAELARFDLFGAKPHLAMSRENVYYRSPCNPATMPSSARLLWYVSSDARVPGTGAVRACSRLVEVTVGSPKLVFKAGKRLGIYEWKDVAQTSRGGLVQALRFCDTECFDAPVPLSRVRSVLDDMAVGNVNVSFPAPQRIPETAFRAIYAAGTKR